MLLTPSVLVGAPVNAGFKALRECPMLVLVGVTGVGKSTTLETLHRFGLGLQALPDRRELTDALIFGGERITDRAKRFERTAAFRAANPGGMAQALEQISVAMTPPILFDGLRGLAEVTHAAAAFPRARFVALDAPDTVRVSRLLGRKDAFDAVSSAASSNASTLELLHAIDGIHTVFTGEQLASLAGLPQAPSEIAAKVSIVVTERQHYDPVAANAFLKGLPSHRALYANTALEPAETIAQRIAAWWSA
jgi:hypothetical protein